METSNHITVQHGYSETFSKILAKLSHRQYSLEMEESVKHGKLKLVLLGDCFVGKSSIRHHFQCHEHNLNPKATIGWELAVREIKVGGLNVMVEMWDTSGNERYREMLKTCYVDALGALLVFDITQRRTFKKAESWLKDFKAIADPKAVILLVGNKCDLAELRAVQVEEALSFAKRHGMSYMETSVKDTESIESMFETIVGSTIIKLSTS